ncbi:DNA-packaging protein [Agrobacterium vitis]|uniref:DNA-packaging protein n=1 Tax=Agrobacterium vitis TaxID=373 RepID=A0AAE4WI55_AGRVI|nr:terminase family protein [Agrobacterium vitis]MCF1500442.1 DNA-packaging protein [Allorhizobium sp. Av2]MCM2442825.1 DNA-packaging protein [Agrobacterium vitis]MUZ60525.1 DNA-packaging protein [Agrobacterium vitis]MVA68546.1 DNA-packaging protein [Agrobacterium vitis]MVA88888.1 DNA-packaging protein [Agrobacterium vitis]
MQNLHDTVSALGDEGSLLAQAISARQGHNSPVLAGQADGNNGVDMMQGLELAVLQRLARNWALLRHPLQAPPEGAWRNWLLMGGRGSGKTRAGAEWVHEIASAGEKSAVRIALVGETLGDAREVMVDGLSGIARIARHKRPEVEISRRRLVWPNGAVAQMFSAEDPESLRGPQFHYAWCDEIAKWKHAEETFDMLQFSLRLGDDPRQVITTTPRPVPILKRLLADPGTRLTRLSTFGNAGNLAPGFIEALQARYGGTRLGRQELNGELIEDREDALWRRDRLEQLTVRLSEPLHRIVVGVDPPSGAGAQSVCGIVVAGLDRLGRAVVLADCSVTGESPASWATAVVRAFRRFEADRVVAEVNQGGEMVGALLKSVDANLPVRMVRATRGKFLRAEPVAALYEQGRVFHAARFTDLEDQMCDFGPEGLSSGRSPDRLDALVWALTALLLEGAGEPRIRTL